MAAAARHSKRVSSETEISFSDPDKSVSTLPASVRLDARLLPESAMDRTTTPLISDTSQALALLGALLRGQMDERIVAIHLTAERRLIALTIHQGSARSVPLPIRAILGTALRLGSQAIIIAHNHPSGDPSPSEQDRESTRLFADAARGLDIRLVDHLVVAGEGHWSFAGAGLL